MQLRSKQTNATEELTNVNVRSKLCAVVHVAADVLTAVNRYTQLEASGNRCNCEPPDTNYESAYPSVDYQMQLGISSGNCESVYVFVTQKM